MYRKAAILENNQDILNECHRAGQEYFIAKEKAYGRHIAMQGGFAVYGPR